MKVKIIKSNSPIYWYAHRMGDIYTVKVTESDTGWEEVDMRECYVVIEDDFKYYNVQKLIDLDDCEIIKENL